MDINYNDVLSVKLTTGKITIYKNKMQIMSIDNSSQQIKLVIENGNEKIIHKLFVENGLAYWNVQTNKISNPFPIYPYVGTYIENNYTNNKYITLTKDIEQYFSESQNLGTKRILYKY